MLWEEISPEAWTRIAVVFQALVTVLVAVIAALLAVWQKSKMQNMERHFRFRDERMKQYSDFIGQLNSTLFLYFDFIEASKVDLADLRARSSLERDCSLLDTASMQIQVNCPSFVVHAVLNVNGRVQMMVNSSLSGLGYSVTSDDFESAKRNMLKSMRTDLLLIEKVTDRRRYNGLLPKQNKRYEKETGFSLESPNEGQRL